MIFSQVEYFLFFGVVFTLYWALPRRAKLPLLLLASLLFYASWNAKYLLLILGSTGLDYVAGIRVAASTDPRVRKRWLVASLTGNLGCLGIFKYYGFFAESVAELLGTFGLNVHMTTLDVLLPVGISFYTFQSMSYTIDIYRGDREPERSLPLFATYVAFFPQLVAGPIVRSQELIPQLKNPPPLTVEKVKRGGKLFFWGLFKKIIFADFVAVKCVDLVFADPGAFNTPTLWLAALGYSLQIYADFSGYTDMARGSALLLGYELPINFVTPFRSRSLSEFWRRWHISLSSWLRDYLYISLGGNRAGSWATYRNLMITMLLGGLWHGAAWTFVAWGFLHGAGLGLHRFWSRSFAIGEAWDRRREGALYGAAAGLVTFLFVCLCFVIFRAATFADAATIISGMFIPTGGRQLIHIAVLGFVGLFAAGTLIGPAIDLEKVYYAIPWPLRSLGYILAMFFLATFKPTSGVPFVYFQF